MVMSPTHSPSVTVVVLVYNDVDVCRLAIESVLAQTYQNLRIKILDNGSTDQTPIALREYERDNRVEVITNGVNQRSEFAVREAFKTDSDFLCFLFSDDRYLPDRIERLVSALQSESDAAAVFSNNDYIDEHGLKLVGLPDSHSASDVSTMDNDGHLNHFFYRGNSLHPCAMLIRTKIYKQLGGFKSYLHQLGDMEFFSKLLAQKKVLFISDKTQLITVWSTGRNESAKNTFAWMMSYLERVLFLENYRSDNALDRLPKIFPELAAFVIASTGRAERLFWLGRKALEVDAIDYKIFGMKCLYDAFDMHPSAIEEVCERHDKSTFAQLTYAIETQAKGKFQFVFKLKEKIKNSRLFMPFAFVTRPLWQLLRVFLIQ